ncbi:MAG: S41 family peptidase [Casimicrobium sp.]
MMKLRTLKQLFFRACAAATVALSLAQPAWAQTAVTVVEYYNSSVAAYFLTGRAAEQTALDGNADFQRTGMTFAASAAAGAAFPLDSVCRYRIAVSDSSVSSHFYGLSADCALIASYNLANFNFEGLDFAVEKPIAGTCPASSPTAVYRALRSQTPVDTPNHRYVVSATSYQEMIRRGWGGEGIVFCAKSATDQTPRTTFVASNAVTDRCVAPRVGSSPYTGAAYPDRQGTIDDEKSWLRSWIDETYLWYREVPNVDVTQYGATAALFTVLKTPARVLSGRAKDEFHFTRTTDDAEAVSSGASYGYGVSWSAIRSSAPREWVAAIVAPDSPAAIAGVKRGDRIIAIDGVDFVNVNTAVGVAALNRGLSPSTIGESHAFSLLSVGDSAARTVTLLSASLQTKSVTTAGTINTPTGRVGYVAFQTFSPYSSESALANAFAGLQAAGVNDLVLDLRYNGGGLLDVAGELAFMIAGPARTSGKYFEKTLQNDKSPFGSRLDTTPFYNTAYGFSLTAGTPLPTLNLGRVFILTSASSCSASEAVINGLKGVGVEVILIGATTCGKPYGFFPTDNCGTTYYSIQFTGRNYKGEGDYINGFAPTCAASDDLTKQLGDPTEQQLAAALTRRSSGVCAPVSAAAAAQQAKALAMRNDPDEAAAKALLTGGKGLIEGSKLLGVPRPANAPTTPITPMVMPNLGDVQ